MAAFPWKFGSFTGLSPRSFTKILTTFQILTVLSNSAEMGPNTLGGWGWDSQHDHVNLVQQATLTALHLNRKRDEDRQELGAENRDELAGAAGLLTGHQHLAKSRAAGTI